MAKIIIQFNTAQEEIDVSMILLKQYEKVGDKINIAICKRNIKTFTKIRDENNKSNIKRGRDK